MQKNQDKPKSWLFEHYENEKIRMYEIIHQAVQKLGGKSGEKENILNGLEGNYFDEN